MLISRPSRWRGAAMVEFQIVALFALLPLCLGALQLALLMAENHHIDHAAFLAARQAAMSQGDLAQARRAFAQGAIPLLITAPDEEEGAGLVARVTAAYARAEADIALYSRWRLISPGREAQQDFSRVRNGQRVIPNDGLEHRSRAAGSRSGVTLQEANVLRLEVSWCRPLIVPFARELLLATLRTIDTDVWRQSCYAVGRVPIRSEGTSPMQFDFRVTS